MSDDGLIGRGRLLDTLERALADGQTVLLFGPIGSGKTAVLHALARRACARTVPCAIAERTASLPDFTLALAITYPDLDLRGRTQRHARSRLLAAVEQRPPLVLLDHLVVRGPALRAALKPFRGTGAGVLLAADIEHERDHRTVRELRLAYLETEIPRLHGHSMRSLLRRLLVQRTPHRPLAPGDLAELVAAAEGLPGRAVWFSEALSREEGWSSGRPRVDWLRSEAVIRAAERYRADLAR